VLAEISWGTRPDRSALAWDRAAILLFALITALYFAQAATLAARAPFWMDEVLSLWTARRPDMPAVWAALVKGAEFTPPLYDWGIHLLQKAGITSALGLRLPSILAIYVAALATGAIVRRHAGAAPAALAAGVVLSSGLFGYAVQIRPYAMVTAVFACALALYDRPGQPSNRRLAGLMLLLAVAIGLHFYALLLAIGLAALELVRARAERRAPCQRTLAAIGIAACSILLWMPILLAARVYSGGDVSAPEYYAQPTLTALARTYAMLLGWLVVPLIGLTGATIALKRRESPIRVAAYVLAAVPIGVFVFAVLVSHSYADRYALVGAIGIALLFGALAQQLGSRAAPASVAVLTLLIVASLWRGESEIGKHDRLDALAAVDAAPGNLPIVTGSGLRFFELRENTAAGARLVFLDTPGTPSPDPTNANQVLRWKVINANLPVTGAAAFVCATPVFYIFAQPSDGGADTLPGWLAGHADFAPPPIDRASVTLVRARPCSDEQSR
jgi:cytochrome bd-type quinol oxidase subunit 2